jgi:hypothetical protein
MTVISSIPYLVSTVAVVIAFFICWAPFHAQRLLFVYVSISSEWSENLRLANEIVSYLAGSSKNAC